MMFIEKRIISYAGIRLSPYAGCGTRLVRQREDAVHLFGGKRDCRRVDPDKTLAVLLHQRTRAARVGFVVQNTGRMRVEHFIGFDLLKGRQQHVGFSHGFGRGG